MHRGTVQGEGISAVQNDAGEEFQCGPIGGEESVCCRCELVGDKYPNTTCFADEFDVVPGLGVAVGSRFFDVRDGRRGVDSIRVVAPGGLDCVNEVLLEVVRGCDWFWLGGTYASRSFLLAMWRWRRSLYFSILANRKGLLILRRVALGTVEVEDFADAREEATGTVFIGLLQGDGLIVIGRAVTW